MANAPLAVDTVDYHTGGEPFRIIVGGVPPLEGATILERRRFALEHLDHVRRFLVHEPRGHADMYGCHVVPPNDAGADLGVVFFHNEGYSTACGHGTIALVTWALESGVLPMTGTETTVTVDVPSGRLACVARCDVEARRVTSVRFTNVPSFVLATGITLPTSRGPVTVDVAYGGAFYGSADVRPLGPRRRPGQPAGAHRRSSASSARRSTPPSTSSTPTSPSCAASTGSSGGRTSRRPRATTPRSPSATSPSSPTARWTARRAGPARRPGWRSSTRPAASGSERRSATGASSTRSSPAASRGEALVAGPPAVITEVEGAAHLAGRSHFVLDPADPLGTGFLLR